MSCQQCICVWLPIVSPVVAPCLSGLSVFCLCSCLVSLSCRVHSPLVWFLRLPFPVIITLCFILYLPSQSCLNVCLLPVPRSCSQVLVLVSVCVCVTFLYFCVWVQFVSCVESSKAIKSALNHWQENTLTGILELILDLHWSNCFFFFFHPANGFDQLFVCLFVYFSFQHTNYLWYLSDSCWGVKEVQCNYWHLNFILNGYLQTWPKQIIDPNLLLLQPAASLWWYFDANWHRILFCCFNVGSNLSLWHSWSPHLAWQAEIICVYLPYSSLLQIFHL